MLGYGEHPLEHFGQLGLGIILLLWPLVVFAFYKKRSTLKNIFCFIHICFAIISVLGAREYVLIVLLQQSIAIPFYYGSAWLVAWSIRWYLKRRKHGVDSLSSTPKVSKPPVYQKEETRMKKRNWNIFFRNVTLILSCIAAVIGFFIVLAEVTEEFHREPSILFLLILAPAFCFACVWGVYALVKLLYILFRWAWRSSEVEEEK